MDERPLSALSLALLGLISMAPQSGYDLKKVFETTPLGHFSGSPGAIYPALERLEKDGLVAGTLERTRTLRPRKCYALTEVGRARLLDTILRPITREDVVWCLDELALRFSFLGHLVPKERSITFLQSYQVHVEAYAQELALQIRGIPDTGVPHGRLALELGREHYLAAARWARRARLALGDDSEREP